MDVRLSPEQTALQDASAQLADKLGPRTVADLDDRERAAKLDAAVAATGWREMRVGEAGAPSASGTEVVLVAEELSRRLADAPFLGPNLAVELRRAAGLPPADVAETVLLAPALNEVACIPLGQVPEAVAVDAAGAVRALAVTPTRGGHLVVAVDLAEGSGPTPVDLTRTMLRPVGEAHLVDGSEVAIADDDLTRWLAFGLAVTSADLVGLMQGAVDLSTAYAADRRQYGAPIGSFQAVQHLLADALVATEGSRSTTLHAGWAVDALDPAAALAAAATAKAYASRAARSVCETAIQIHGGIGNTWECLAHIYLRRALLSSDVLGGTGPNIERVLAHHQLGEP